MTKVPVGTERDPDVWESMKGKLQKGGAGRSFDLPFGVYRLSEGGDSLSDLKCNDSASNRFLRFNEGPPRCSWAPHLQLTCAY